MSEFAADYERDENGWVLFPRDVERRKELFPQEVFEHPAKANMFLTEELIYYLTEPGDHILDPFGGTGTTMIAALLKRPTTLIDIEPQYCRLMEETVLSWSTTSRPGPLPADIHILHGDCRQVLPIPCNAIITSPPYSQALGGGTGLKDVGKSNVDSSLRAYSGTAASPLNIGRLNPFYFERAMDKVYQKLAECLPSGAPMAFIVKDFMRGGGRFLLSEGIIRQAHKNGFAFREWYKWATPGSAQRKLMKAKGSKVVEDEDIIIFRRA